MTKADVFLIITQIYIVGANIENKRLLFVMGFIWLMLFIITGSTT